MQRPIPINEAEAIIEPFWDERISNLPLYQLIPGAADDRTAQPSAAGGLSATLPGGNLDAAGRSPGATAVNPYGARAFQFWCWATLAWDRSPPGKPVLSIRRTLELDLTGYDRLLVKLGAATHVRMSLDARIDGQAIHLIDRAAGRKDTAEYEAPVDGRALESLTLTLDSESERAEEVWLVWIGCAHAARRAQMLARPNPFGPEWEGELHPPGATVDFVPRLGLVFGAEEVESIRRRALSPLYRPIMDQLRERARQAMASKTSPEDQMGPYHSTDTWKILARDRERGWRPFYIDAAVLAFVGLVDRDAVVSRFAARVAMSLIHTEHWHYTFMQGHAGSTWDIRGFPEAFTVSAIALVVADWAGSWFTTRADHLVRFSIATKGLPKVREVFLQWEYMWNCNQTHMIGLGRLLGLIVMARSWPRTAVEIDQVERDFTEMIDRYVKEDGSSDEGVGYWSNSFRATVPALAVLARYRGKTLPDLVHPRLHSTWSYIGALSSTAGEAGSYLPIADTVGNRIALDAIGGMAAAVGGPWSGLLGSCLAKGRTLNMDWTSDGVFAIVWGPDDCPSPGIEIPVFSQLSTAGMVSSNRSWPAAKGGTVRLFLVGAMPGAGHSHRDKGSFILEADGETLLADRGMTPYEDASNVPFLKSEEAHNLAVPEGAFQQNPSPHASQWTAQGDAVSLRACVDTSRTWLEPVVSCRRTLTSVTPDHIEIVDEIELSLPLRVRFYLQTPVAAEEIPGGARVTALRSGVTARGDWVETARVEPCGVDWSYHPYSRVVFTSASRRKHKLVTLLDLTRP